MATQQEILKERELLKGMGLKPIKMWSPRCRWFNPDGSPNGILPCDPYSRLKYLGRGLRPEIGIPNEHDNTPAGNTLEDAIKGLVGWSGTATELLSILRGSIDDVPVDATRLSKALNMLASRLARTGIHVAMTRNRNARGISIMTLDEHVSGISSRS